MHKIYYLYIKTIPRWLLIRLKKSESKKVLAMLMILTYIAITVIFYENFYSIFPMIANSSYLLIMIKGSRKALIIGGIVSSIFWLLYAISKRH